MNFNFIRFSSARRMARGKSLLTPDTLASERCDVSVRVSSRLYVYFEITARQEQRLLEPTRRH